MINKNFDKYANKIVNAFLKNKIISPIPSIYTKKILNDQKFRTHLELKFFKIRNCLITYRFYIAFFFESDLNDF